VGAELRGEFTINQERDMPKHTAGPWAFTEGDAERRASSSVHKADDPEFQIAHVTCEWQNDQQRAEDIANAKLIAAAPELLAACEWVVETIQGGDSFEKLDPWAKEIVAAVRATIAKAKGEA
jgi:hypothetical protein